MTWDKYMTWETAETVGLCLLILACGLLVVRVLSQPAPKTLPSAPVVKAAKALPAFHLLARSDLDVSAFGEAEREAELKKYENRRLLVALKKEAAVTDAAVATRAASALLENPLTASIPATPAATLGGRLKTGDVVDLASVSPAKGGVAPAAAPRDVYSVQSLVVIGLPAEGQAADKAKGEGAAPPGAVVLAFTSDKLEAFMKAVGGEGLVLLRPNTGANQ